MATFLQSLDMCPCCPHFQHRGLSFPFPFIAVGAHLPLPLLPFPFSGSKGDSFPLPLPSIPKGGPFSSSFAFHQFSFTFTSFPVGAQLASSIFAPQCTNVHGRRSSSVHSPEVRNMSRLVICSNHIFHSLSQCHSCPLSSRSVSGAVAGGQSFCSTVLPPECYLAVLLQFAFHTWPSVFPTHYSLVRSVQGKT